MADPLQTIDQTIDQTRPPADGKPGEKPEAPESFGRYRVLGKLGSGSFGIVYRGYDEELHREVTIKVANPERIASPADLESYLKEARILASLDHPGIVAAYDLGRTEGGLYYLVSKYVEECDLATWIRRGRPSLADAVDIVARMAEALNYAHQRGLVHRDIKPANVLMDSQGRPHITDFGLALRQEEFGTGPTFAGTPTYMSPEQARDEGHRVDGRSDIYSLGVVFYELLTGQVPFRSDNLREVLEQIKTLDPRPPRQLDGAIPRELERICLKALAKRASDRYSTAMDYADDLRQWQSGRAQVGPIAPGSPSSAAGASTKDSLTGDPRSSAADLKVIPRGLRSFEAEDADYFLRLLPGPKDRSGLPDTIRFWKKYIEALDLDETFAVGLIYGPSGCGKSSLVKAGLLPRLADHVVTVYVEATSDGTEARLLKGLHRRVPGVPNELGLAEALAYLRRERALPTGKKMVFVVDQFEQWLHAHVPDANAELIQALRQCDGQHVQCILMIRDDFWMATTRFLRELEVKLVEGRNSTAVDLFDPRHARRVLAEFGHAYGCLLESPGKPTPEHERFLDQAIGGLAEHGKVSPVRLSLFAEMLKGRAWTASALKAVGGTDGLRVTFLEETFSAPSAPTRHRVHQKAARAILKALLPEQGPKIKGHMRSYRELLEVSGYAEQPEACDELLHILDSELRLVTPTDPEGSGNDAAVTTKPTEPAEFSGGVNGPQHAQFYQLTHDYMVSALRQWLTRKQAETIRGRAQLRLAEIAAEWNARPTNRHLPGWWTWTRIRMFTRPADWTAPQQKLMRAAGRYHAARASLLLVVLLVVSWGAVEIIGYMRASALVRRLGLAGLKDVPEIVRTVIPYRRWVDPLLTQMLQEAPPRSPQHLHASLALLPVDSGQINSLCTHLIEDAKPDELDLLVPALAEHSPELTERLWGELENTRSEAGKRLRAACALAVYDLQSPRWTKEVCRRVAADLLEDALQVGRWGEALSAVGPRLRQPLVDSFRDPGRPESARMLATSLVAEYARQQPDLLAELIKEATPAQYAVLYPALHEHGRRAIELMESELARVTQFHWKDGPLSADWQPVAAALVRQIENAGGMLAERMAFCQTMPLPQFLVLAEQLRLSGYRPTRFRPYDHGGEVRVAAVWTRDSRDWQLVCGVSASEVRRRNTEWRKKGYAPIDTAGYVGQGERGPTEYYTGLWMHMGSEAEDYRLIAGLTPADFDTQVKSQAPKGIGPISAQSLLAGDNKPRFSVVLWRPGNERIPEDWNLREDKPESEAFDLPPDCGLLDVAVFAPSKSEAKAPESVPLRYTIVWSGDADMETLENHAQDPDHHLQRCQVLAAEGWRPRAMSVAWMSESKPLATASVWHRPRIDIAALDELSKRKAVAAITLLRLGRPESVWQLLRHSPDPSVRSQIIHLLGPLGVEPETLLRRLEVEQDTSVRRALLLCLGEFSATKLASNAMNALMPRLVEAFRTDPDPGIHAAVEWLMRRWQRGAELKAVDQELATQATTNPRDWYITPQGQTMVAIPGPARFLMGSLHAEPARTLFETPHRRAIPRSFCLSAKEITVSQFQRFLTANPSISHYYERRESPDPDGPILWVSWYQAAQYCRWLSEQEEIADDQMCYPPIDQIKEGMSLPADYLQRTGYRLPTEAEWEFACRAGAATRRFYGISEELLGHYGWYSATSSDRAWPGGLLKPNDFGLFDVLGNAAEWTHSWAAYYPGNTGNPIDDREEPRLAVGGNPADDRLTRGGAYNKPALAARSASRTRVRPGVPAAATSIGFRVARTRRGD
jgi:serine/threonine protein kinase/formylglycine-generating enzyme required for sulfatase activity